MEPQPAFDPYAPPEAAAELPVEVVPEELPPLARRSSRLAAKTVDSVAALCGYLPIVLMDDESWELALLGLAALAILAVVQSVLLYRRGQTLGKLAFGLRIVRSDGRRAGLARIAFLRFGVISVLGAVPRLGQPIVATDIFFIFRADRRCVHDHLADTIVIDLRAAEKLRRLPPPPPPIELSAA